MRTILSITLVIVCQLQIRTHCSSPPNLLLNISYLTATGGDGIKTYHHSFSGSSFEMVRCIDMLKNQERLSMLTRDPFAAVTPFRFHKEVWDSLTTPPGIHNRTGSRICNIPDDYLESVKDNSIRAGCFIGPLDVCDGLSMCSDDECGCGETFRCADGVGCVAINQVCDSRIDCWDRSDECPCKRFQECVTSFNGSEHCPIRKKECSSNDTEKHQILQDMIAITSKGDVFRNKTLLLQAVEDFPEFKFHLDRIQTVYGDTDGSPMYKCTNDSAVELTIPDSDSWLVSNYNLSYRSVFCDDVYNCLNRIDEQHCPQYFYCKSDMKPIPKSFLCDRVPHCVDTSDECDESCTFRGLSSSDNLIDSLLIKSFIYLQIILILTLNGYACWFQYNRDVSGTKGRMDRIQCCTLIFYDFLMAIYLMIIIYHQDKFAGRFCVKETEWRSSTFCQLSGFLFFFSSYGSLQVVLSTSISRSIGICCPFIEESKLVGSFMIFNCIINLTNLILSALPIIGTKVDSLVRDVFLYEFIFTGNPLIDKGNKSDLAFLLSVYSNDTTVYESAVKNTTSQILSELSAMFDNSLHFQGDSVRAIGFYGKSNTCVPDFFSTRVEIYIFKVALVAAVSSSIIAIGLAYLIILNRMKRSKEDVGKGEGEKSVFYLSAKVYVVIFVQVFSWIPLLIAMVYSLMGGKVPNTFDEVVIAIISPTYSVLNPCLHTDISSRIMIFMDKHSFFKMPRFGKHGKEKTGEDGVIYANKSIGKEQVNLDGVEAGKGEELVEEVQQDQL